MKCKPLLIACFGLLVVAGSGRGEDSLFSRTPINSVFVQPGAGAPQGAAPAPPPQAVKLSGSEALSQVLGQAGLDATAVSENTVSTKIQHAAWSFPALVTTAEERNQLVLVLLLTVVKQEDQLSAEKLLKLMNANRDQAPAFFAYSEKRKRIELYRTLDNSGLTPEQIRGEITALAQIAAKTQELWKLDEGKTATAPAVAGRAPAGAESNDSKSIAPPSARVGRAAPTTQGLIGRWAASRSKTEAFAMHLKADGTYALVHVKQGKQTRSSGKFTLEGTVLTLAGSDGTKLTGSLNLLSQKEFEFQPSAGKSSPLTFKKAG